MVDQREKAFVYKAIGTLQAYRVVDQARRRIVRHWRGGTGAWRQDEVTDAFSAGVVPIPCPTLDLTLDEICEGVDSRHTADQPRRVREPELA